MSSSQAAKEHTDSTVSTLIGAGTLITGTVLFSGGMRVDGEIRGSVRPAEGRPTTLIVGPKGRVDGDVRVDRIVASGTIVGRIDVLEVISIHAQARIQCDIEYAAMEIDPGADVQGRMTHRQPMAEIPGPTKMTLPLAAKEEPAAQPQ